MTNLELLSVHILSISLVYSESIIFSSRLSFGIASNDKSPAEGCTSVAIIFGKLLTDWCPVLFVVRNHGDAQLEISPSK